MKRELATADGDFEITKRLATALGVDVEKQHVTNIEISIRADNMIHVKITKELFRDEYVSFVDEITKYRLSKTGA